MRINPGDNIIVLEEYDERRHGYWDDIWTIPMTENIGKVFKVLKVTSTSITTYDIANGREWNYPKKTVMKANRYPIVS